MIISWDPEIQIFAHPKTFLDLSERWGRVGFTCTMDGIVKRHLHEVFPETHHWNLETGARDLKVL